MYAVSGTGNEPIDRELRKLEQSQYDQVDFVFMKETHVALSKPRSGMIIYADGSDYDPGSGQGLYYFTTQWIKVGTYDHDGYIYLDEQTAEPGTPVEGQIAFADGTIWDPGSGQGIYAYYGAAWNKL